MRIKNTVKKVTIWQNKSDQYEKAEKMRGRLKDNKSLKYSFRLKKNWKSYRKTQHSSDGEYGSDSSYFTSGE